MVIFILFLGIVLLIFLFFQNKENFDNMNSNSNSVNMNSNTNFVDMNSDRHPLCSLGPTMCSLIPFLPSTCPYTCKTFKMSENRTENNKSCTKDTYTLGDGGELVEETCKDI
jgi:hypothetical protein